MKLDMNKKLDTLENEILSLKLLLMKLLQKKKLESLRLGGALSEIKVSEEDIEEAKTSLFNI